MSKTIVFCADGTWNGPGSSDDDGNASCTPAAGCEIQHTNVCKLFAWLDGVPQPDGSGWGDAEMEKMLAGADGRPFQVAKYIHGVGNSSSLVDRYAGGAFGVGVTLRIARGYTYISRNYAAGDRIVIVGFSRGAYTARALAGLIAGEGLLQPELVAATDDTRYDTAAAAWYRWRSAHGNLFQKFLDGVTELLEVRKAFSTARALTDASFVPDVPIAAVAVWDTVGSLGIPVYVHGEDVDVFRFCDTKLSDRIALGLHAVALDEERKPFLPTLWDSGPHVTQALFPGGHCDVGGGYPEAGLSDTPLTWMLDRLQQSDVGLRFTLHPPVPVVPDPLGARHRAWAGNAAWTLEGVAPRLFPDDLVVNDTVRRRAIDAPEDLFGVVDNTQPYRPQNLPRGLGSAAAPSTGRSATG